jgi:hypothetical protein
MTTATATLGELARDTAAQFEWADRDDGTRYVRRKDTAEDWVQDLCQAAHGTMFPDDHRYRLILDVLDHLADCDVHNGDDAHEAVQEMEPDPYTSDLLEWAASHSDRLGYADDAIAQGTAETITAALGQGQMNEIYEVANVVIEHLQQRL